MNSTLLPPDETARRLGLTSEAVLAQWRHHKRYPLHYVRIGKKIFYREEDVQDFIEIRTVSGDGSELPRARAKRTRES